MREINQQIYQYLPRPHFLCTPTFEPEKVFTNLPGESMEDLYNRVWPMWEEAHKHLVPPEFAPRVLMKPESGHEDGYFSYQTRDNFKIEGRIHRKPRRKYFDATAELTDKDPWRRGSCTFLFFENTDRMIVIQSRRGNRMSLTKSPWTGYTLMYEDHSIKTGSLPH